MKENMETLKALDSIEKRLEATCLSKCGHGWNENCICGNNFCGKIERIRKDLELLERYEKAISILRWCANVLEELKNETSEEEYDFIKEVLDL